MSSWPNLRAQSAEEDPSRDLCVGSAPMPMSCDTSTCRPFPAAAISAVAPVWA